MVLKRFGKDQKRPNTALTNLLCPQPTPLAENGVGVQIPVPDMLP